MQWWYDRLIPWKHYIPVRSDLSDVKERFDWAEANQVTHLSRLCLCVRACVCVCVRRARARVCVCVCGSYG